MFSEHDETALKFHQLWRDRLAEARSNYQTHRTPETRQIYLDTLRAFTALVTGDTSSPQS